MNQRRGHAAMLLFSLVVSISFLIGQYVAGRIEPLAITAARFWVAFFVFALIMWRRYPFPLARLPSYWRYLLPGAAFALYFVLMFEALKTANPLNIAVIFTLNPFFAAIFDRLLNHRKLPASVMVALIIGLIGTCWVIFDGDFHKLLTFEMSRGEFIFLIASIAHALYPALLAKFSKGEPAPVIAFVALGAATLLTTFTGAKAIAQTSWLHLGADIYASILYLGLMATALSFFLIKYATTKLPSAKILAYTYVVPFWVALELTFINHAPLPLSTWIGGALIGTALVLLFFNRA